MPVIYQGSNPDLYEYVEDRNLQGQWFLLETLTEYALKASSYRFSLDTLYALHHSAAVYLDESPGSIRKGFNHIINSSHVPPAPEEVPGHLYDFFGTLNDKFEHETATHLAAYSLWRITWIHPFNECNGRTARVFAYLVLCKKIGAWLPGRSTIHERIKRTSEIYYESLQMADRYFMENNTVNVEPIERYLKHLVGAQVIGLD